MSTVQPTDKTLVNRAGVDHSAPADMSTVQDTDLLLINRAGVDYKCTFADWKNSQGTPPDVGAVTLADVAGGDRFTSVAFPVSATMTDDGKPTSTKKLKAYVSGEFTVATETDVITAVNRVAGNLNSWTKAGTTIPNPIGVGGIVSVNGTAVMYGDSGSYVSTDGITWAPALIAGKPITKAMVVGDRYYGVVGPASQFVTSTDGQNWTVVSTITQAAPLSTLTDLAFGNGIWVIMSYSGTAYSSTDGGTTWTAGTVINARRIAYAGNGWFVAASSVEAVQRSQNGVNWSTVSTPGAGGIPVYALASYNGVLFMGGSAPVATVRSTDYGATWQTIPSSNFPGRFLTSLCYSNGAFYALNEKYVAVSTDDAQTWTAHDFSGTTSYGCVGTAFDKIIVATNTQEIYTATASKTTLTFASDLNFSKLALGQFISEVGTRAAGSIVSKSSSAPWTMSISSESTFNVGNKLSGDPIKQSTSLYCVLNAAGAVSNLQAADPGFTAWTPAGTGPYTGTVTFPATLPTGNAPDADLPAGTTITVEVEASNTSGTDSAKSNTVTPA